MDAETAFALEGAPLNRGIGTIEHVEYFVFLFQYALERSGAEDEERLKLAQMQQAHDFIDIRGGKEHATDRGVGRRLFVRIELRRADNLSSQIRRSADEKPDFAVVRKGDLGLRACGLAEFCGSNAAAVFAGAVPLWESASSRRTQDFDAHDEPAETRGIERSGLPIYSSRTQKHPLQKAAAAGLLAESGSRRK